MAVRGVEIEIISPGLNANRVDKGSYVQNLEVTQQTWAVRRGFGQIGQFDTGLGLTTGQSGGYGYTKHLGSYSVLTDFGDVQVISVMSGRAFTGEEAGHGSWRDLYFVSIFDVTTRSRWEHVIHIHTSQFNEAVFPMPHWHGVYETDSRKNYENYPRSLEESVFFAEFGDMLIFGNDSMGMYGYNPATFYKGRRKQTDGVATNDWKTPYSESSLIWVVHPTDGLFPDEYQYMDTASFPSPVDAVMTRDFRLVMAVGREVYFSDSGRPASIITDNFITVPSDKPIVALEEIGGALLIFTESELFHYVMPVGALSIGGRLTQLSDRVGVLSPSAMTKGEQALFWMDSNGVYFTDGSMSVQTLSEDIKPLFDDQISSPMTSYYVDSGSTTLAVTPQPRITYDLKEKGFVSMAYEPSTKNLFIGLPNQNALLCLNGNSWSIWPLETCISPTVDTVGATANIENPWVTSREGEVFVVGSVETYTPVDVSVNYSSGSAADNDLNAKSYSYYVLQLGVGGSLDRTVDVSEDNRTMAGYYKKHSGVSPTKDGYFFLDEPIEMPDGYKLPSGQTANGVVLFPLRMVPDTTATVAGAVLDMDLVFTFDDVHWEPVTRSGSDQIDVLLPPTRIATGPGWGLSPGTKQAGSAEVTFTAASHLIELRWSGAYRYGAGGSFSYDVNVGGTDYAVMNCNRDYKNDIMYLPFKRTTVPPTNTTMSMGITPTVATMADYTAVSRNMGLYSWEYASVNNRHSNDDVAQSIDWCMKSPQVGLDVDGQVKTRGIYARFLSHGRGTVQQGVTWRHGQINAIVGSDWKDWVSQIIDYTDDIQEAHSKTPLVAGTYIDGIRTRIQDSAANLRHKTFNNVDSLSGVAAATWGNRSQPTEGNYLIDNEEYDVLSISESVKGDSFSWMLFGHLRNRAEKLIIGSIKAVLRPAGSRRRKGR
tara:strand:- start:10007 stop:12808 length:2802 start_codon:yes stop_codon:yes gene_type:complete